MEETADWGGCVEQMFALKTVKNTLKNRGTFYVSFLDVENACDRVDRCFVEDIMNIWFKWKVTKCSEFLLGEYGMWVCVCVGSEWFMVKVCLYKGYLISPLLFSLFMARVVKFNARVFEQGESLLEEGWELSVTVCR